LAVNPLVEPAREAALAEFSDVSLLIKRQRATIYRAREIATDRWVALKVLNSADPSTAAIEAFDREAAVLAAIGTHPHIVTFYRRLTLSGGAPLLVLELCQASYAERHPDHPDQDRLSSEQAVSLGIKIAGALDTAHRAGVLHRGVAPANILVTACGEPALGDFGVAALHHTGESSLFDFTTVHTAPELLEGHPATATTDVYSLASTLYDLVSGAPAFRTYDGESPAALSLRILCDPVPRIDSADVPLALTDVLLWAMSRDPAARPPSAAWFADELARVAASEGWPRTPLLVGEPSDRVGSAPRPHGLLHRRS
jgi:serine/threonine protein kinase